MIVYALFGKGLIENLFSNNQISVIGLLVEPNWFNYQKLLEKHRKATSINACYSTTSLPTIVDFVNAKDVSGIQGLVCNILIKFHKNLMWYIALLVFWNTYNTIHNFFIDIKVPAWISTYRKELGQSISKTLCFPFYSILLAMGNPTVDYFSLDVEGAELQILQTIPWDKVDIKVRYFRMIKNSNIFLV